MHFPRWVAASASVIALWAGGIIGTGTPSGAAQTPAFPWKGSDPSCEVRLPIPGFVAYGSFATCPPKRVLVLGDSVALTMGIQLSLDQEDWGTLIENAAINGCGFVTGYDVRITPRSGSFALGSQCESEATIWVSDVRSFGPQAIVVEMGWWDSFPHVIKGKESDLSQPRYDARVESGIRGLIRKLRTVSAAPIYFLSVPWMRPPILPNGQPRPAASTANHVEVNRLIRSAARSSPSTHFIDISPYITPTGHFQTNVGGGVCRTSDGVHLYYTNYVHTECGKALQRGVLSIIRENL